eukprot:1156949-Pelagomonas_calceolata.AAC.1
MHVPHLSAHSSNAIACLHIPTSLDIDADSVIVTRNLIHAYQSCGSAQFARFCYDPPTCFCNGHMNPPAFMITPYDHTHLHQP